MFRRTSSLMARASGYWQETDYSVPPGFCDSAIAEFITKSSKLCNFRKSSHFFVIGANCPQILGLDVSRDVIATRIQSKKGCFSVWKNWMKSLAFSSCGFARATLDKQTERGTNPRSSFGLCGADCLSARAGAVGYSRSHDTVIHSAGRYSEESSRIHHRINNICKILWEAFKFWYQNKRHWCGNQEKHCLINTNLPNWPWI